MRPSANTTTFNERVLELTKRIPRGRVTTYKIIAEKLNTKAYRAVGQALHNNKRPVIIPCHRVVKSDGSLGGYAKGDEMKMQLLRAEGIEIRDQRIQNFKEVLFCF